MNVRILTPREWEEGRFALLRFGSRHGERRNAQAAWRAFVALEADELGKPGTAVAVTLTGGGQPAGLVYAAGYGEDGCVAAVHPAFRGRGIARGLLERLAGQWGRLTCFVAADNPAGLAACFGAGLVAVGLGTAPAGKPMLRLVKPEPGSGSETKRPSDRRMPEFGGQATEPPVLPLASVRR